MRKIAAFGNVLISYLIPVLILGAFGIMIKKPAFLYDQWLLNIKPNIMIISGAIVLLFLITLLSSLFVKSKASKGKYFSISLSKSFKTVKSAQIPANFITFFSCVACFIPTFAEVSKGNPFSFNYTLLIPVIGIVLLILNLRITGILGSALFYNMFMQGLINSEDQKELSSFSKGLFKSLYAANVGYKTANGLN